MFPASSAVGALPQRVPCRWPQESFQAAFRSLFPPGVASFELPVVEDLLLQAPFRLYEDFLEAQGLPSWGPHAPVVITSYSKGIVKSGSGVQAGHHFSGRDPGQLVNMGLSKEDHLRQALQVAEGPFPLDTSEFADFDLHCAARWIASNVEDLADRRGSLWKPLAALAIRLRPVSAALCRLQPPTVRAVAGDLNIAFVAALVLILAWPDTTLPERYIFGFSQIGILENSGTMRDLHLRPQDKPPLQEAEVMARSHELIEQFLRTKHKREEDEFLHAECIRDLQRGTAGPLRTRQEMDARWGRGKWLPLPRFQIVQASGKKRPIDDGARNAHNEMVRYFEALDCPTPTQPATQLRALVSELNSAGTARWGELRAETGTEDMPDAYRFVPIVPAELSQNIVAVWGPESGQPVFQEIFGHVFGKSAAIINFHRLQRLVTAACRRLLALLISFYYDDATLQDLNTAKGRGQRHLRGFFPLLGRPLSASKAVDLDSKADYLGLEHDVAAALSRGVVRFRPRDKLHEKVAEVIARLRRDRWVLPSDASKLRGINQFMAAGAYGRVGSGGMTALIRRQYADRYPFWVTAEIEAAFRYFEDVMRLPLRRECLLWARRQRPLVVASDGRLDESAPASIATSVVDPETGSRRALLAAIPDDLIQRWSVKSQYIAHVEQAAVVMGVLHADNWFQDRDAIWLLDNTVALSAMIKGSSAEPDLARAAASLHLVLAHQRSRVWFEYIESDSNWADEPSRALWASSFLRLHGFHATAGTVPAWPWTDEERRVERVLSAHSQRWGSAAHSQRWDGSTSPR